MRFDLVVSGGTLVLPGRRPFAADVGVEGGRVAALLASGTRVDAAETIDARGLHVLPGAIDTHTHWGYRGDFGVQCESDSRAAAIGGVTTAHLFHRMKPGEFDKLRRLGEERSVVDFTFTPAVYDEASGAQVDEAAERWGCPSLKFYLAYRALPDAPPGDDWNGLTDGLMLDAMERLAAYSGGLACVHAENAEILNRTIARVRASGRDGLAAWADANPGVAEAEAILRAGFLAERAGVAVYFVHLSGRDALGALARVRSHWPRAYGETCPHYLFLDAESAPPAAKFSPPVRSRADADALWRALAAGELDCVGSDNASTLAEAKAGSTWEIARGGPGAGTLLPIVLSEGVYGGRLSLERAVEVTSTTAARLFGLYPRKGTIEVGSDADLALVDLALERTVSRELFGTWSDYNLYEGAALRGWPAVTLLRGQVVARDGRIEAEPGLGRFVARPAERAPAPVPA